MKRIIIKLKGRMDSEVNSSELQLVQLSGLINLACVEIKLKGLELSLVIYYWCAM